MFLYKSLHNFTLKHLKNQAIFQIISTEYWYIFLNILILIAYSFQFLAHFVSNVLVIDRVHQIRFSGYPESATNGFQASWKRLFFSFANFLAYLMIWQICRCAFDEKSSNMPKIWQQMKTLINFSLTHFSMTLPKPETQVSGTWSITIMRTLKKKISLKTRHPSSVLFLTSWS